MTDPDIFLKWGPKNTFTSSGLQIFSHKKGGGGGGEGGCSFPWSVTAFIYSTYSKDDASIFETFYHNKPLKFS